MPGIVHEESLRNLIFPLDWQAIMDYVGMPCVLKDAHGGGWKDVYICHTMDELLHHYNQFGLRTMIVQEFIEWEQYVRCICLGQEDVLPIKYDPGERKYHVEHQHLSPELGRRIVDGFAEARARAGLRHGLAGVGDPRRRTLRHRLHEPGAGYGHQFADAALLRLGGDKSMADMAIRLAKHPRPQLRQAALGRLLTEAATRGTAADASTAATNDSNGVKPTYETVVASCWWDVVAESPSTI